LTKPQVPSRVDDSNLASDALILNSDDIISLHELIGMKIGELPRSCILFDG